MIASLLTMPNLFDTFKIEIGHYVQNLCTGIVFCMVLMLARHFCGVALFVHFEALSPSNLIIQLSAGASWEIL